MVQYYQALSGVLAVEMKVHEFLFQVTELLQVLLPGEMRDFQTITSRGGLVKVHYGNPSIHYEVWVQRRAGQIELGLHFEGVAGANASHLEGLKARFAEIHGALGGTVEPEQWTRGWTRIHETLVLENLDEEFLVEVSSRLARFIQTLQPMLSREGT